MKHNNRHSKAMMTHSRADDLKMSERHLTWLWDGCLVLGCCRLAACTAHDMTCWRHCEWCHRTWYWGHWCLLLKQQQQTTELYNVSKRCVNITVMGRWIHYEQLRCHSQFTQVLMLKKTRHLRQCLFLFEFLWQLYTKFQLWTQNKNNTCALVWKIILMQTQGYLQEHFIWETDSTRRVFQ
jgi:hypothetical protein